MKQHADFKKEWPKIRKQLMAFSKDALTLAKKGEKQLVKITRQGKLHLDSTALNLKREHIYHLIGKEYVTAKSPGPHSAKMKKLLGDLIKLERESQSVKKRITRRSAKKKTASRGTQKAAERKAPRKKR